MKNIFVVKLSGFKRNLINRLWTNEENIQTRSFDESIDYAKLRKEKQIESLHNHYELNKFERHDLL